MKIAYLHYHLKPGGVTTVIRQQVQAMKDHGKILVVSGREPGDAAFKTADPPLCIVPGLGYDSPASSFLPPEKIADHLITAISEVWPSGCDILHVHNPLLAKNRQFLKILYALQARGVRLLLQIHDFAEDGRVHADYGAQPYPADCHYCVINFRDYQILRKSGLRENGLHLLPNMVTPFSCPPASIAPENLVLYPVRAIRRKNIGEAMLMSLFFPSGARLAITLPPNSPKDWEIYGAWKAFAATQGFAIAFEASHDRNFRELTAAARAMITTSISEGFGFSFLEPWTAGKLLIGRRLPGICRDFEQKGMRLDHLYESFWVPLDTFDFSLFSQKWKTCFQQTARNFGAEINNSSLTIALDRMTRGGILDFKFLDEGFQKQVLAILMARPDLQRRVREINPFLSDLFMEKDSIQKIQHNRGVVEAQYNQDIYRQRLLAIYDKVLRQQVAQTIQKKVLLSAFLSPENFSLLKWGDFHV